MMRGRWRGDAPAAMRWRRVAHITYDPPGGVRRLLWIVLSATSWQEDRSRKRDSSVCMQHGGRRTRVPSAAAAVCG
eukprot:6343016-Prymnesium_polylepis.1